MNDIIENNNTYVFVVEFDENKLEDFKERKEFISTIDGTKTVKFYEAYKNEIRYINDDFIIVCEDYRYGFSAVHNIGELILYPDDVKVYNRKC